VLVDVVHLVNLKGELVARWPMTSLLDVLKETDLRVGITPHFANGRLGPPYLAAPAASLPADLAEKQGIDDALIQPYSGHASRKSLEIYSQLAIGEAQLAYDGVMPRFPV
jgi:hypothetical protein